MSEQEDNPLWLADRAFRKRRYSDAFYGYLRVFRNDVRNTYLIDRIVTCCLKTKRYSEAISYLHVWDRIEPNRLDVDHRLMDAYLALSYNEQAILTIGRILDRKPNDRRARKALRTLKKAGKKSNTAGPWRLPAALLPMLTGIRTIMYRRRYVIVPSIVLFFLLLAAVFGFFRYVTRQPIPERLVLAAPGRKPVDLWHVYLAQNIPRPESLHRAPQTFGKTISALVISSNSISPYRQLARLYQRHGQSDAAALVLALAAANTRKAQSFLLAYIARKRSDSSGTKPNRLLSREGIVWTRLSGTRIGFAEKQYGLQALQYYNRILPMPGYTVLCHETRPQRKTFSLLRLRKRLFLHVGDHPDDEEAVLDTLERFLYRWSPLTTLRQDFKRFRERIPTEHPHLLPYAVSKILNAPRTRIERDRLISSSADRPLRLFVSRFEDVFSRSSVQQLLERDPDRSLLTALRQLSECRSIDDVNELFSQHDLPADLRAVLVNYTENAVKTAEGRPPISPDDFSEHKAKIRRSLSQKRYNRARKQINHLRRSPLNSGQKAQLKSLADLIPNEYAAADFDLAMAVQSPHKYREALYSGIVTVVFIDRRQGKTYLRGTTGEHQMIIRSPQSLPNSFLHASVRIQARFIGVLTPSGLPYFKLINYTVIQGGSS